MRVKIYQINSSRDSNHVKYLGLTDARRITETNTVDPSVYDEVFNAQLDTDNPEEIFAQFNHENHPLFRGHSLSVSDVIVTDKGALFCDRVGFKSIDFDESKTQKPDDLMKIVYVEPGRPAYEAEIRHDLESTQKAVGGLIDIISVDGCAIVLNDEGKLMGLKGNRHIGETSVLAGPFFVCGDAGAELRSLTEKETEHFLNRFAEPEDISDEEVRADMGFTFISL